MEEERNHQLKDFKLIRMLMNSPESQSLIFLGYFDDEKVQAILILKKKPFSGEYNNNLQKIIKLDQYFENDIFRRYKVELSTDEWNELDLQTIYPATQKLINKYTKSDSIIIVETPDLYNKVTQDNPRKILLQTYSLKQQQIVQKYIEEVKTNSLQWLYNVLEGKAEQDRILFCNNNEQDGFIILPNFSFSDFSQTEQLYLLSISMRRDISSLRDLRGSHIPLLEAMQKQAVEDIHYQFDVFNKQIIIIIQKEQIIKEKFAISKNKIRAYIHYQPTYYHLHLHFTHIEVLESSMNCDRSHPLHQVIHNLKIDSNYYKNAVLMYSVQSTNPLYNQLKPFSEEQSE